MGVYGEKIQCSSTPRGRESKDPGEGKKSKVVQLHTPLYRDAVHIIHLPVPIVNTSFLKERDLMPHPLCLQSIDFVPLCLRTRGSTKETWDCEPTANNDPSSFTVIQTFSRVWRNLVEYNNKSVNRLVSINEDWPNTPSVKSSYHVFLCQYAVLPKRNRAL